MNKGTMNRLHMSDCFKLVTKRFLNCFPVFLVSQMLQITTGGGHRSAPTTAWLCYTLEIASAFLRVYHCIYW